MSHLTVQTGFARSRLELGWPKLVALAAAARPNQWVKNLFVGATLVFSPAAMSLVAAGWTIAAIACFCCLSSAGYILNDLVDRRADQLHSQKRNRVIATGRVSVAEAGVFAVLLLAVGIGIAGVIGFPFLWFALLYVALSLSYTVYLKQHAIVDVITIAIVFAVRVYAGAAIISVKPSPWILLCTGLLALFIALAKRRDDLERNLSPAHRESLAGYTKAFLDTTSAAVLAALLVAYAVYTTDATVIADKGTDKLYLTVPFVVAGILRYLQITLVERRSGDPVALALRDSFLRWSIVGWLLLFVGLMYR